MEKKEILEGIEKLGIYDFISNEGYKLDKEQLIIILKEVDFELYNFCKKYDRDYILDNNLTYKNRTKSILTELEDRL